MTGRPDKDKLVSVKLPSTLLQIGNSFAESTSLKTVDVSASLGLAVLGFVDAPLTTFILSAGHTANISGENFYGKDVTFVIEGSGTGYSLLRSGAMLVRGGTEVISYPSATGTITIDESGITTIAAHALRDTTVTSVTLGAGITTIAANSFNGCNNLTSLTLQGTTVKTLSNVSAFTGTNTGLQIFVPTAQLVAYQAATNWKTTTGINVKSRLVDGGF
jgi:hypothetical protein